MPGRKWRSNRHSKHHHDEEEILYLPCSRGGDATVLKLGACPIETRNDSSFDDNPSQRNSQRKVRTSSNNVMTGSSSPTKRANDSLKSHISRNPQNQTQSFSRKTAGYFRNALAFSTAYSAVHPSVIKLHRLTQELGKFCIPMNQGLRDMLEQFTDVDQKSNGIQYDGTTPMDWEPSETVIIAQPEEIPCQCDHEDSRRGVEPRGELDGLEGED